MVKGVDTIIYTAVLLKADVQRLEEVKKILNRRKKKRKKRLLKDGCLTIQEGQNLIQITAVNNQI